jgi:sterol desaturase/sphingolipid hydroxylase (fatty acid hydroxylase superfamily)
MEMHKPEKRFFSHWSVYKFLARHHYLHHRYQNKNFNVVLPLADYVLGTSVRASRADLQGMYRSRLL